LESLNVPEADLAIGDGGEPQPPEGEASAVLSSALKVKRLHRRCAADAPDGDLSLTAHVADRESGAVRGERHAGNLPARGRRRRFRRARPGIPEAWIAVGVNGRERSCVRSEHDLMRISALPRDLVLALACRVENADQSVAVDAGKAPAAG